MSGVVVSSTAEADQIAEWREAVEFFGLQVDGVRTESAAVEQVDAASAQAVELGAKLVVVGSLVSGQPSASDLASWREVAALVARREQVVAVDFGASESMDARAMSQFIATLAEPRVQLCFDLGAYASRQPFSHWEIALQRVCTQLAAVWLSDASGTPRDDARPPLGEGMIDFFRTLEIVRSVRFAGLAVVDVAPPRRTRGSLAEQLERAILASAAHLRRCGWFDP